jgi:hypothetical protein
MSNRKISNAVAPTWQAKRNPKPKVQIAAVAEEPDEADDQEDGYANERQHISIERKVDDDGAGLDEQRDRLLAKLCIRVFRWQ